MIVLKVILYTALKMILVIVLATLTVIAGVLSFAGGIFRLVGGVVGAVILISGIIGGIAGVYPEAEAIRTCIGGIAIGILPGMFLTAGSDLARSLKRTISRI